MSELARYAEYFHQRFGQFIENVTQSQGYTDAYYVKDHELVSYARMYYKKYKDDLPPKTHYPEAK